MALSCRSDRSDTQEFYGGRHGQHNHSDHRRYTVGSGWRLVRAGPMVLSSDSIYIGGM
jgi:hypothetical protein